MAPAPRLLSFLGMGALFFLGNSLGSSFHSFRTMYTAVTKASPGVPGFTALAYVDDQLLARYESTTRMLVPHIPWMKKAAVEDPRYVDRYTQVLQHDEENFKGDLVMLRKRYNQSEGLHTVQMAIVCEVRPDGSKGGRWQYGYDGRDFISFDMETLAWTAPDPQAQVIKRTWESETGLLLRLRSYLEETCMEWLQKDMAYREEEGPLRKGTSSHSLRYFYTGVSEPGHGLPHFSQVGYLDDQPITRFDSSTRRKVPVATWMKEVEKYDPHYWDSSTEILLGWEEAFRVSVANVRNYYNQSKGFHSLQRMEGCELREDGSKGGYQQSAYDGKDYISFDKDTLTWVATDPTARITQRKWEKDPAIAQSDKAYLEEICMEWLQRYLKYGKERLLRKEPPEGKVTLKAGYDDRETLVCQAYGFYPKEIEVTWRKDGEVLHEGTFHRDVAPLADGTYHAWLSLDISPKDRDQYRCHVDHGSLQEPLVLAWEKPGPNLWLIVGCVVAALLLIPSAIAVSCYFYKKNRGYNKASTSDKGSNSSSEGTNPVV